MDIDEIKPRLKKLVLYLCDTDDKDLINSYTESLMRIFGELIKDMLNGEVKLEDLASIAHEFEIMQLSSTSMWIFEDEF